MDKEYHECQKKQKEDICMVVFVIEYVKNPEKYVQNVLDVYSIVGLRFTFLVL